MGEPPATGPACRFSVTVYGREDGQGAIVVMPRPPASIRRLLEAAGFDRVIALTD